MGEVALFVFIAVHYFRDDYQGPGFGMKFLNLRDLSAQEAVDLRESVSKILFPCLIATLLIFLFSSVNVCICCCSGNKCFYGFLLATGIVILAGTTVMTILGTGAKPPLSVEQAVRSGVHPVEAK